MDLGSEWLKINKNFIYAKCQYSKKLQHNLLKPSKRQNEAEVFKSCFLLIFLLYLNCFICLFIMDNCNSWIRKHLLTSSLLPVPIFLPLNFTNLLDGFLLNSHLLGLPINQTGSASGFFPGVVIFHERGYWFVRQLRVKTIQNQWLAFLVLNNKNDTTPYRVITEQTKGRRSMSQ